MDKITIAVPSNFPGGLNAQVSEHFGHCDVYTLVQVADNKVVDATVITNPPHEHGGCLAPVQMLADNKADVLIAFGIGKRPLAGFQEKNIKVYQNIGNPDVNSAVQSFMAGKLQAFAPSSVCQGGCSSGNGHHHAYN